MGLVKSLWVVGGENPSHRGEEWAKLYARGRYDIRTLPPQTESSISTPVPSPRNFPMLQPAPPQAHSLKSLR
jgi:hypothetical protein